MLLGSAVAVVTVAGIHAARGILGPLFLALVLTIVVHPVRVRMRRRVPSWVATTTSLLLAVGIVLGLVVSVALAIARFASLLTSYGAEVSSRADDATAWLHDLGMDSADVHRIASSFDASRLAGILTGVLSGVVGVVSGVVFVVALCFFMAIDAGRFPEHLTNLRHTRPQLVDALSSFASGTFRYLLVSTVFGAIVAILDTVALWAMGVPAPLVWGLLAFLTNYIPNIGFVIGLVPPAVLALVESGPELMIAVIAVYCLFNLVIQSAIQPKIVGDAVGLSTTLTFISLIFWSWIVGPVGTILAVPMTLLARALLVDADPDAAWLTPLIGNPKLEVVTPTEPDGAGEAAQAT